MRIRKVICALVLSAPVLAVLPGQASAECINGVNASVMGDARQTNTCTTGVTSPTP